MNYKPYILKALFCCVFLVVSIKINAQELSLSDYLNLVKKNNTELQQSKTNITIAKEDVNIAKSFLRPSLSADAFYQRDFNKNYLFINDDFGGGISRFRTNFNNTVNLSATVSQVLFDAEVFSTLKITKLAKELRKLTTKATENELLTQASVLYWQAVYLKESIAVFKENAALANTQMTQIKTLFNQGEASKLQVYQTEISYQKTLPSLTNAKKEYQNIINQLKNLAGIVSSEEFILTDTLESLPLNTSIVVSEATISKSPQLKALQKSIDISEQHIKGKRKFWYPKANLVLGYNYSGQDNNFKFNNNQNKLFFGQLRLTIPIISGGKNKAEIVKSKLEKTNQVLQFNTKKEALLKDLHIAQNNYQSAIKNIENHKNIIQLAKEELEVYNKQLALGVITTTDYKAARMQFIESKLTLLESYVSLHIAQLQIQQIINSDN